MKISTFESDSSDCEEICIITGKKRFFQPTLQKKLCLGQNNQQQNQQFQTISGVVENDFGKSGDTPFKLQSYDKQSIQLQKEQMMSSKQLKEVKQNQDNGVKLKNSYQLQLPRYKWQSFFFLSQFVTVFPNVQWRQSYFYPKGIQFDKVRSLLGYGFLIEGLWLHQVIVFPDKLTDDDLLEISGNMLPLHDVPHTYSVVIDNMAYLIANPRHGTGQPLASIIGKQRYLDFCKEQDAYQLKLKGTGKVKKSKTQKKQEYDILCPDDEYWYSSLCEENLKIIFDPQRQDDDDRIGLIKPNKQNFLIKQALIKEISKKVIKDSIDERDDVYQFMEAISKLPLKIRFAYIRTPQGYQQEEWKTNWRTCLFSEEIIPQGHLEGLNDLMIFEDGQWWQQTSYHSEEYFTEFVYYVIIDRKAYRQIQTKKGVKGSMLSDLIGVKRYDQFCKQYDMAQMNNQQSQSINSNKEDESDFDQLVISYLPPGLTGSSKEEFWWQHQTMGYPYDEKQLQKEYPPTPPINSDYDEDNEDDENDLDDDENDEDDEDNEDDSYYGDKGDSSQGNKNKLEIFDFRSYGGKAL